MLYPAVIPAAATVPSYSRLKAKRCALLPISMQGFARCCSNAPADGRISGSVHASCLANCDWLRSKVATVLLMMTVFVVPLHAEPTTVDKAASERALAANPFTSGTQVPSDTLSALRGGSELGGAANLQKLGGTVADNTATNIMTGANSITAGAFANVSGIPIVIQNSGANVLIQNATIINLQLQ